MKNRLKKVLNKKGETLVESIVSILMFTLLVYVAFTAASFCSKNIAQAREKADKFDSEYRLINEDPSFVFPGEVSASVKITFDITDEHGAPVERVGVYELGTPDIKISDSGFVKWEY